MYGKSTGGGVYVPFDSKGRIFPQIGKKAPHEIRNEQRELRRFFIACLSSHFTKTEVEAYLAKHFHSGIFVHVTTGLSIRTPPTIAYETKEVKKLGASDQNSLYLMKMHALDSLPSTFRWHIVLTLTQHRWHDTLTQHAFQVVIGSTNLTVPK